MLNDNEKESWADVAQRPSPRSTGSRRQSRSSGTTGSAGVTTPASGGSFCGRPGQHPHCAVGGVGAHVAADSVNAGRHRAAAGGRASPVSRESGTVSLTPDRQDVPSRALPAYEDDVSPERLRHEMKLRKSLAGIRGGGGAAGGGGGGGGGGRYFTPSDAGGTITTMITTTSSSSRRGSAESVSIHSSAGSMGGVLGSFTYVQLQLLAFIIVFSASGLVPRSDLVFVAWVSLYTLMLARFVFPVVPTRQPSPSLSPQVCEDENLFRVFVLVGALLGVFFPMAYSLGGFSRGDQTAMRASTPHLFLLSCQILTENFVVGTAFFSVPTRVLVSIMYNVRRLSSLADWMTAVYGAADLPPPLGGLATGPAAELVRTSTANRQDFLWIWFGRALALANMVFWSFNLFCILLPVLLPRAFRKYFEQEATAAAAAAAGTTVVIGHHSTTTKLERQASAPAATMTLRATATTIAPHHPKYH